MDQNGVVGLAPLPEMKMPAEGGKYQTFEKLAYTEALAREQDERTIEEINAAREAIAAAPHRPEPKKAYKLLPTIDATEGPEPLQLAVALRRLQIVSNGYIVSYTIWEYGRLVYLENLHLPRMYRIGKFQP